MLTPSPLVYIMLGIVAVFLVIGTFQYLQNRDLRNQLSDMQMQNSMLTAANTGFKLSVKFQSDEIQKLQYEAKRITANAAIALAEAVKVKVAGDKKAAAIKDTKATKAECADIKKVIRKRVGK